ncbi:MAG: DNA polymerase I [Wenzhouxiangellaceae bacterium]
MTTTLYLVDGSSYLYRAFHALPPLTGPQGQPTGALYGVANMVRRLLQEENPQHIAVVFDAKGKNFRHQLYPQYKANRPPMPDELRQQLEPLKALIEAMGIPLISVAGVEADDVIATLVTQAREQGWDCMISASDKDLAQLVDEHVVLVDTMSSTRYDRAGVEKKFGVGPEQIVDYLALVGDTSDNIPGIDGVGPKTAAKWLGQYGDLESLMAAADEIKGKAGERLRSALEQLPLSQQLATVKKDVELPRSLAELQRSDGDAGQLRALFEEYGFKSWLKGLDEDDGAPSRDEGGQPEYHTVRSAGELKKLIKKLAAQEQFVIDLETTSLDPLRAEIVGIALAYQDGEGWYIPVAHVGEDADPQLSLDQVMASLQPLLEDPQIGKIGQNLKYDLSVLWHNQLDLKGIRHDTMLESYVYNSTASRHDMDSLAAHYLQRTTIKYEEVAGKGAKQVTFDQVPVATASQYAAEDAEITLALHQTLWRELAEYPSLVEIYQQLELPLVRVLARMETNGILLDRQQLADHSAELSGRLATLQEQAWKVAGREFNLASTKQLREILYGEMELKVLAKTPTGQPSTSEDVLHELAVEHELPRLILEHRSLAKLKNTYTDRLPEQINPDTGRVHTSFHQAVAATGRLSSSDPNLQNIPVRTEEGRRIRKAFIAPPGRVLLACDYSQIELRIMAHLSSDDGLLKAFHDGVDIHRATAGEVFDTPYEDVSAEQRRAAKAINFGLIYGMSAFGLARQLEISREDAQQYIEIYFERYPGVRRYMDETRKQARDQGYVETLFGRRLWLRDIRSRNGARRQAAERAAINAPMQGTAADIIKRAMISVDQWLEKHDQAQLILQVHDELVLEVDEKALDEVREAVIAQMAAAAELRVPLVVDAGSGADWETAH